MGAAVPLRYGSRRIEPLRRSSAAEPISTSATSSRSAVDRSHSARRGGSAREGGLGGRERDRLLRLPAPSRLAVLDDDESRGRLTVEHRAEVRASLAPAPTGHHGQERSGAMAAAWEAERRRLAVLHASRMVAPAGIVLAALLPFGVSAWRAGMGPGGALAAFLAPGQSLAGVARLPVAAAVLAWLAGRTDSLEGLAGLAVALGRVF